MILILSYFIVGALVGLSLLSLVLFKTDFVLKISPDADVKDELKHIKGK